MSKLEKLDYYTLLGLERGASTDEIKLAFRKFARRYHPDRFGADEEDKLERATKIYRRGSEAYQILLDPVARKAYDQGLRTGNLRLSSENRDKAARQQAAVHAPPPKAKKQEAPIRSPHALQFYQRAAALAKQGKWREAWQSMKRAVEIEPENELLRTRLSQIEGRIRMGG